MSQSTLVYATQCDNERLPFADNQFDTYIANYSLHIVNDPVKMLEECKRVLKPGGTMAMSIWGRRKYSPFFTLLPMLLKSHGVELPKQRTYFHLEGKMLDLVKSTGFKSITNIQNPVYINLPVSEILNSLLNSPFYKKIIAETDK